MKKSIEKLKANPLIRKSMGLTILLYLSPVIGMILEIVLLRMFSAGGVLDVFRALMTFMLMGQGVIASQLLKYAVVPQLADFRAKDQDREGLIFAMYFTLIVLSVLSPVVFVGLFHPESLLLMLAPGFSHELIREAAGLVQVTSFGFMLLTIVGSMSSVLHFYGIFWGQPLGQLLSNSITTIGVLIFGSVVVTYSGQFSLLKACIGIGLVVMLAIMIRQCLLIWKKTTPAKSGVNVVDSIKLACTLILPQLIIISAEIIKPIAVNRALSQVGVGSIALYLLAFRLQMIGYLPVQAIVTVLFPSLSRLKNEVTPAELLKKFVRGSMNILILTVMISGVLWFLADIIVLIIGYLANLAKYQEEVVINIYRIFLCMAPFSALGLYYMESAFAFKQVRLVVGYALINTAGILIALNVGVQYGPEGIAICYAVIQGVAMTGLGVMLYRALAKE